MQIYSGVTPVMERTRVNTYQAAVLALAFKMDTHSFSLLANTNTLNESDQLVK